VGGVGLCFALGVAGEGVDVSDEVDVVAIVKGHVFVF
jgi:hypothetical protein